MLPGEEHIWKNQDNPYALIYGAFQQAIENLLRDNPQHYDEVILALITEAQVVTQQGSFGPGAAIYGEVIAKIDALYPEEGCAKWIESI